MPFGFLKRGRRAEKEQPPASVGRGAAPAAARGRRGIAFDALTEEWRLVGLMEIEARLSDVLNRREEVPITDVSWAPADGSGSLEPAPGLERVDPFDLIVVFAGEGSLPTLTEAERAAFRLHKVPYDVALEVPPYRVLGTVYLFPGSEPDRLLDRATELFIPVTEAVTMLDERPVAHPGADVVLVNRSYLRSVQQVDRRMIEATRALVGRGPTD